METDEKKAFFVNSVSGKKFTAADAGSAAYQSGIDEISVSTMVNEHTVPVLLAYGPNDKIVNPRAKYPLPDALETNGVEPTYIEFPHSGHGLSGDPDKTAEYFRVMEEYPDKFFENGNEPIGGSSLKYEAVLRENGIPTEVKTYEEAKHGFIGENNPEYEQLHEKNRASKSPEGEKLANNALLNVITGA